MHKDSEGQKVIKQLFNMVQFHYNVQIQISTQKLHFDNSYCSLIIDFKVCCIIPFYAATDHSSMYIDLFFNTYYCNPI